MNSNTGVDAGLEAEAGAFDTRILDRTQHGFVPDLRHLEPNDYFYKSFWRRPTYADLYVGEMSRTYLRLLAKYCPAPAKVLDAGCGPGYFSLELARAGYSVVGIDISEKAIASAKTAAIAVESEIESGSLLYFAMSLDDARALGPFDAVLSSGFLHHIPDVKSAVNSIADLLKQSGILVLHEPQHHDFRESDAVWVMALRQVLALQGSWYEPPVPTHTIADLQVLTRSVHEEFILERDPDEVGGQSPNDLSSDRSEIMQAIGEVMEVVEDFPSRAFIYRLMGGLRGDEIANDQTARFLAVLDEFLVGSQLISANYFYAVAKKTMAATK